MRCRSSAPWSRCTAWSSAAAATTPATGSTTSRPWSGWPASATTSGRRCWRGCASGSRPVTSPVRSVDEHLAEVLGIIKPLMPLEVGLLDAHGCVLAEDLLAPAALPGFDNSAMDGYAVRVADLAALPAVLPVVGDIAAGPASTLQVQPGVCVRIMTGAMLPRRCRRRRAGRVDRRRRPAGHHQPAPRRRCVHPACRRGRQGRRAGAAERHPPGLGPDRSGRCRRAVAAAGPAAPAGRRRVDRVRAGGARRDPAARADLRLQQHVADHRLHRGGSDRLPGRDHPGRQQAAARRAGGPAGPGRRRSSPAAVSRSAPTTSSRRCCRGSARSASTRSPCSRACRRASGPSDRTARRCSGCPATRSARWCPSRPSSGRPCAGCSGRTSSPGRWCRRRAMTELRSPAGKRSFLRVWLEVRDGAYVVSPVSGSGSHLLAGHVTGQRARGRSRRASSSCRPAPRCR